jgi:hypothetical protein
MIVAVDGMVFCISSLVETDWYDIMIELDVDCAAADMITEALIRMLEAECFKAILEKLVQAVISEELIFNFEIKLS